MASAKRERKEAYYDSCSSGHITNLSQSILETFNIYGMVSTVSGRYKNTEKQALVAGTKQSNQAERAVSAA
jgi:hypothetical protein